MRKKLPIGIQTFRTIRQEDFIYVDKTDTAYKLIDAGRYYFLSRPRRFGKSLFLDTLAEIFKGNRELFKGLAIYDKWNWSEKYPVIKIDFGKGSYKTEAEIIETIRSKLFDIAEEHDTELKDSELPALLLERLLKKIYMKYNSPVVVLIDEYDKPIIDNISNREQAAVNRTILADFYAAVKGCDEYLKFVMLTGVSRFSKVNLFSSLNNLKDITIDRKYATITGYTQNDLESCFTDYLENADLEMVKKWYNGYNYFGEPIYNPYDILLFLSEECRFDNYWWETGNPSFLIELLKKQKNRFLPELENTTVTREQLSEFDVDHIDITALLWQTGYLTFAEEIVDEISFSVSYRMKVPNLEIQCSLNTLFLEYLTNLNGEKVSFSLQTGRSLREGNMPELEASFRRLFASIANSNYTRNLISEYEGYYASVIFTHIASLGYDLTAEDYTNKGRIDLTVKIPGKVYIFEFKVDTDEPALKQIRERRYYEKYLAPDNTVYMIGINFSSEQKNISEFQSEVIK